MLPSLLTALLFAASGICGRRSAVHFGALMGNTLRLGLAVLALGTASHLAGRFDWESVTVKNLLLSGVIGFGLGDVALFLAYRRLGVRLTLLLNLSSAPMFGALLDWQLTGIVPTAIQALAGAVIVAGVAVALLGSSSRPEFQKGKNVAGVVAALVAGLGQGFGAAITRLAKESAVVEGVKVTAYQEAFIRAVPGLAFSVLVWLIVSKFSRVGEARTQGLNLRHPAWLWLAGAALFGPILGVSCFQWALGTASSAVVLSITASTPILVMPLARWVEGDRPGYAAVLGAFVAVAGVVWMGWLVEA